MTTIEILQLFAWEVLNPAILKTKQNKIYHVNGNINGINLGCGIDNPENWLGLDGGITHFFVNRAPKPLARALFSKFKMAKNYDFEQYFAKIRKIKLIHHELTYGIPFPDNSVPNIYSSHFFEHLFKSEAEFLLRESYRVLKNHGMIRICVPLLQGEVSKIKQVIQAYDKHSDGHSEEIQKYVTSDIVGYNSKYSNHRYMYDFAELQNLLAKVGFVKISQYKFRQGQIPDVEKLDTRQGLFVEAIKTTEQA